MERTLCGRFLHAGTIVLLYQYSSRDTRERERERERKDGWTAADAMHKKKSRSEDDLSRVEFVSTVAAPAFHGWRSPSKSTLTVYYYISYYGSFLSLLAPLASPREFAFASLFSHTRKRKKKWNVICECKQHQRCDVRAAGGRLLGLTSRLQLGNI